MVVTKNVSDILSSNQGNVQVCVQNVWKFKLMNLRQTPFLNFFSTYLVLFIIQVNVQYDSNISKLTILS
jgi:hypothetical protein